MSIAKTLDALEEKFYGELEEDRNGVLPELQEMFDKALAGGEEKATEFINEVKDRFGGIMLPHIFWVQLSEFMNNAEKREEMFETIRSFTESNFEDTETKRMKPLLITYFATEKEFELNKLKSFVIEKAHPSVQEYFEKLMSFADVNKKSVEMYLEKFRMLKNLKPDFSLLRLPVMKLKEKLAEV